MATMKTRADARNAKAKLVSVCSVLAVWSSNENGEASGKQLDDRTTSASGRGHSALETVGAIDGAAHRRGKGPYQDERL